MSSLLAVVIILVCGNVFSVKDELEEGDRRKCTRDNTI